MENLAGTQLQKARHGKLTVEHFDAHVKEAPGSELKTHS